MIARSLKRVVKQTVSSSWGWRLFGPLLRRPGVIVLMYHRILGADRSLVGTAVERFAAQMRWIAGNCEAIGPEELVERARRPSRLRPAVLITFDDGYRDYHDLAYPVLRELGLPALVFLATSFMDAGGTIWTDDLQWSLLATRRDHVRLPWRDGPPVPLPDTRARDELGKQACAHLKTLPEGERLAALSALFTELGELPRRERQMLTWEEVRRTSDLTRYGGHTHTHPILSRLGREDAEREIRTCRERITAETGRPPQYFAYPNGRPGDYTAETQEILRRNGFTVAFSTSEGIAGADSDWMAVKRLPSVDGDVPDFVWLSGGCSDGTAGRLPGA
jgi:peptidoglycan/xylan/chitin deacetylase (PgdA/CDA1 family)